MESNDKSISLPLVEIDLSLVQEIPRSVVDQFQVMPISREKDKIVFATPTPEDVFLKDRLESSIDYRVRLEFSEASEVRLAIETHYGVQSFDELITSIDAKISGDYDEDQSHLLKSVFTLGETSDKSILAVLDHIIHYAILHKASDIHIEPSAQESLIRMRVDGVLHKYQALPEELHDALVSVIKIQSDMDITQKRTPQDGQFELRWNMQFFDARIATAPTIYGEKVSIRLLKKSNVGLGLETLGFSDHNLSLVRELMSSPAGLLLVVGPTGSGKTTTLFSMLSELRSETKNIITVEDPVEYRLEMVNQIEVNVSAGLTFERATRSLLRQDPDVILIGEIRDRESATLAVQSALAGTLLMSTLHSSNASLAIERLINIGAERSWVSSTLSASIAQRLVRRICPVCTEDYDPNPIYLKHLGLPKKGSYKRGRGCSACRETGYMGRICISEVLVATPEVKQAIYDQKSPQEVKEIAKIHGYIPFAQDAKDKIVQGISTPEEIFRVLAASLL